MATSYEKIKELEDKINAANERIAALKFSLYDENQPGGSWKTSEINNKALLEACKANPGSCTVEQRDQYATSYNAAHKIVVERESEIRTLTGNIAQWNSQIETLRKDPQLSIDVINAEAAAKIKRFWIYVAVAIAGIYIIGVFITKKWNPINWFRK